jgi:hypothetical protein
MTFGKKSLPVLSILGVAFCAVASAAPAPVPAAQNNLALTIPAFQPGFEVNFTTLWLKPNANNLDYAIKGTAVPLTSNNSQEQKLSPGYSFAFDFGARYLFQQGQDISFDWVHLDSKTNASATADSSPHFVGPAFDSGIDAGTLRNANSTVNFKYDVMHLDAGQFVDVGSRFQFRFFGGVNTGFLREEKLTTFNGVVPTSGPYTGPFPGAFYVNYDYVSTFTGAGPRLGFGTTFNIQNGFGVIGEAAASILAGVAHTEMKAFTVSPFLQNNNYPNGDQQGIRDKDNAQVIPGFDGKLGLSYEHVFNQNAVVSIQGGYEAAVYINAVNQYAPATIVQTTASLDQGLYVATMKHTQSNYVVHGPFLKFALKF